MLKVNLNAFAYAEEIILRKMNFTVSEGTHISILGESGCGKSTLLQLIYGLLQVKDGEIYWKDKKLLGPDFNLVPGEPFIKYLAQDFDLMPYISVADNIAKFLSRNFMKKRNARVAELLEVVDMVELKDTHVKFLSGGQKQRVALARAIAKEPELLLLDEPFSHIDHFRRNALRRKLYRYLKKENITCITATHDSEEALSFADEIKMMRNGAFIHSASPEKLFESPKDEYVASFFGDVNVLPAALFGLSQNEEKLLLLPHQLLLSSQSDKQSHLKNQLKVQIKRVYFKGDYYLIEAYFDGKPIYFKHKEVLEGGEWVFIGLNTSN